MILAVGARPVFADVDPATLNVDPAAVERAVTDRTRAIVPVHFAGQPVDLDPLRALAARHGVALIEDAAHALGATYRGRPVGGGSTAAVFSFHPIKAITTGEGGMVTTDDADFAERLRLLRFHGITRDAWKRYGNHGSPDYEIVALGYKYNLTDLQAALGIAQLARLEEFVAARTRVAGWYADAAPRPHRRDDARHGSVPARHAWHCSSSGSDSTRSASTATTSWASSSPRTSASGCTSRRSTSIGCIASTPRPPRSRTRPRHRTPILSLPLFPAMVEDDVRDVVDTLADVLRRHAA